MKSGGTTAIAFCTLGRANARAPAGKARDLSLREKERQIQQDLFNQIVPNGGNLTVLELVEKYLSLKVHVRHNTLANYNFVLNIPKKEDFGRLRIDKVKQSDAKAWLISCSVPMPWSISSRTPRPGTVNGSFP